MVTISFIITIILFFVLLIALFIFKYFIVIKEKNKINNIENENKEKEKNDEKIKDEIFEKMKDTIKAQKLLNNTLKNDIKISYDKIYYEPVSVEFTYDYELISVSENFLKLKDVSTFEDLKRKYKISKLIKDGSNIHDVNLLINVLNQSDNKYKITFNDIFDVTQEELEKIDSAINNTENANDDNNIIYHGKILLNVDSNDLQVKVMIDIKNNNTNKTFKVIFRVYEFIPKVSPLWDNFGSRYKDLIQDIIINLSFPLFIIDINGIRFLNKCSCDWFQIPYHRIDNIGNGLQLMHDIFDRIDLNIINEFNKSLKSDNQTTVYLETVYNINDTNTVKSDSGIKFIPRQIIIEGKEFIENGKVNLFVTITEAKSLHTYIINHKDFIKDNDVNIANNIEHINNSNNKEMDQLTQLNFFYKDLFKNSSAISFARININDRNIIVSNNLFDENISASSIKSARYLLIINHLIERYNYNESNIIGNYYSYDVTYKDLNINIKYTYGKDYIDIFIFDKEPSNNDIEIIKELNNTSDLSIITVNKLGKILLFNNIFEEYYLKQNIDKDNMNILDLIPESNKNKFKRSLSDSIKFNSYNLNNTITLINKDNKEVNMNCIRRYIEINNEQFITITMFPINNK